MVVGGDLHEFVVADMKTKFLSLRTWLFPKFISSQTNLNFALAPPSDLHCDT